jgi:hypothetical protein
LQSDEYIMKHYYQLYLEGKVWIMHK